jgi:hypothetical protein
LVPPGGPRSLAVDGEFGILPGISASNSERNFSMYEMYGPIAPS